MRLLCAYYVLAMCLLCAYYVITMRLLCDCYVIALLQLSLTPYQPTRFQKIRSDDWLARVGRTYNNL
jgi:hypothetical protein